MLISTNLKIANEQIKLVANFLNTLAAAIMIIGFLTPVFAFPDRFDLQPIIPFLAIITSLVLHFGGNRMLLLMREVA